MRLKGEEHEKTLSAANNYACSLLKLKRFEETKALMRRMMPGAQRVLGEDDLTLKMRGVYALALYEDPGATLDDLREAVATLEDTERTARRVFGGAHPVTTAIERRLRNARAALAARETSARVEAPARLEEALARVDRLERELVEARRQVAELRRTVIAADAPRRP